jgi:hypothetical protein
LFHLPQHNQLDNGDLQSQHDRVRVDWHAHVADANAVHVVPCEQQLHAEFHRLLRMPLRRIPEHHDDWRQRPEPRYGRLPHDCGGLLHLPPDYNMGGWSFRSQRYWVPTDQWTRGRDVRAVSHQQQLRFGDCADRLRKFWMPFDYVAGHE